MPVIRSEPAEIALLPDTPAVFTLRMHADAEPYVGKTKRLRSRVQRLLEPPTPAVESKRLTLAGQVATIEYVPVYSEFEARLELYRTLKREFPASYRRKLRMRTPPVIRIAYGNPFPRAVVTRRIGSDPQTVYFGPFRSRKDAEQALHAALDLYLVRRCVEDLAPAVDHLGCVYGEMKMCMAPCQLRASAEEYRGEVRRLERFLETLGEAPLAAVGNARDEAAAQLAFEQAAALHVKHQKMRSAAQQFPECVRRIDRWDGMMLQPGAEEHSVRAYRVHGSAIAEAVEVRFEDVADASAKQLYAKLRDVLDMHEPCFPTSSAERVEHLWVLQKWLYRNPKTRTGELVLADVDGVISSRKLANVLLRLLKPGTAQADPAAISSSNTAGGPDDGAGVADAH
ncbi:MAG TPA: hypothetical protein VGC88_08265 [Terriglobales bacterium]